MKKRFSYLLAATLLSAIALVSISSQASSYSCGYQSPIDGSCYLWLPGMLPGAHWCNGDPGYGQVNLYTGASFSGQCQTISVNPNTSVPNLDAYGWNSHTSAVSTYLRISSVKTGPGAWFAAFANNNYSPMPTELGMGNKCLSQSNPNLTWLTISSFIATGLPPC